VHFSIGEAVAALSITLAIPQFLKPIYLFRLKAQAIRLTYIYVLVFGATAFTIVAALLPTIGIAQTTLITYPIAWELLAGLAYVVAFGAFARAFLATAGARKGNIERFVRPAAELLAHAREGDRVSFARDLLRNTQALLEHARFLEGSRSWSAFFEFTHERKVHDARYAWSLMELVSEPRFCETLVQRSPWDAAAMVRVVSERRLGTKSAKRFVQELARQAIMAPSSMMTREVDYMGFRAAPVLSNAIFSDPFVRRACEPLNGLRWGLEKWNASNVKRLNHAVEAQLELVIKDRDFWGDHSLNGITEFYTRAIRDCRRGKVDDGGLEFEIRSGLTKIVEMLTAAFNELPPEIVRMLYQRGDKRDFTTLDFVSEAVVEVLFAVSNEFRGPLRDHWFLVHDLVLNTFPAFQHSPNGFDPLQQRIAYKLVDKVEENMEGLFPAVTRVLLATLGPAERKGVKNDRSAFSLLSSAVYAKLKALPNLVSHQRVRLKEFLPDNVTFDPEQMILTHTYTGGTTERTTLTEVPDFSGSVLDEQCYRVNDEARPAQ
jgi:hypothetical protein